MCIRDSDNMPSWAKPTIQKLMDRGYLNVTGDNELGLTMDIIRMCVRIDVYKRQVH